ncbi:FAD/NAD(P)-binding protein [Streptomyces sp. NPDC051569]|uniref:FAD/NAD(P)-binding protein n=1 Tax=Streptomyces sp. NPDC051569 TaxID=3365661 RepID=UPI0037A7E5E3
MSDVRQPLPRSFAVVGAGPRGTSVLERLCASVPELAPGVPLIVHVVDPAPAGAGRVWRTDQPAELLMNTVASQVTVFTDESVACEGPIRPGPSLYEWAAARPGERLGPDDYPSRAAYGRYLEWAFRRTVEGAPESVTVKVHRARAIRLDDDATGGTGSTGDAGTTRNAGNTGDAGTTGDAGSTGIAGSTRNAGSTGIAGSTSVTDATGDTGAASTGSGAHRPPGTSGSYRPTQTIILDDGTIISGLSAVVLAQGHLPVVSGQTQLALSEYATRYGLRYLPPANPADVDLSAVAPGEPVLLRGLGLNFFDHMALLTAGRGGTFARGADGVLVYHPSGREPQVYAGSRRGVPYQARGDNAKGPSGRHRPLVLTPEVIADFRERADKGDPPDFLDEIWPLVAKEVESVFYGFRGRLLERFLAAPHGGPEEAAVLDEAGIGPAGRWSWDRISRPYGTESFHDPADHRAWLLAHLRRDAAQAALGNVAGPVKAALDVLRDVRNELRQIVDHAGLSGASRRDHLDRWYTPLNAFLSIGPPRRRIEEMAALVEAGVLDVIGPRTTVRARDGVFVAESPDVPGSEVRATTLVEARLPEPDLRRSSDPLLSRLLKTGQCRTHVVDGYETGGLDVTRRPYRLLDRQGRAHPRRFALGVPTEGVHWVTAAGARPGVDSVMLSDTDAVARATLRTPAGGEAEYAARIDRRQNVELASID